jgi:GDP-L-fucose synthase
MTILITGGTGMVGKNLQQSFSDKGIQGVFVGRGQNNQYDLCDWDKTRKLFSDIKPDIVIHAGANVGGIGYNLANPASLIRDNLKMGINVLDACVEFKISNLYITSTCCAYPERPPTMPMIEDELWFGFPEVSNSGYGIAKKTIMKMAQDYRQQYGLKSTSFILANLYGMHDHFDLKNSHVVPALIRKFSEAKENNSEAVECWGDGTPTRDLFFCKDLGDILTQIVINRFDYPQPINLGTGKDIAIDNLASLIASKIGYKGLIIFKGAVSNGQPKRVLNVSRARQLLSWQATTSLEDGLSQTIEWYRANKDSIL